VASSVAFHNAVTRYALAIANEGLLPRVLTRVHPRTRAPYVAGVAQTLLALVVVVGFAVAGADPYQQLLIWVNTPGIFGILLLQVLAAVSVVVHFRRHRTSEGLWRTVVAPVVAATAMSVAIVLAATNIELLTGATAGVNAVILMTLPATCVLGLVWALWLRTHRREVFDRVGGEVVADGEEVA